MRRIDEDSMDENTGMNFAEFVAVLSGNMDLLNKAKLDNRIMQLEKEKLEYDLQHKSQEMANLMINFVRKNEMLTEIKSEIHYCPVKVDK